MIEITCTVLERIKIINALCDSDYCICSTNDECIYKDKSCVSCLLDYIVWNIID